MQLLYCARGTCGSTLETPSGKEGSVDPVTLKEQTDDEAFDNIVVLEPIEPDDDWMPGEFDIA